MKKRVNKRMLTELKKSYGMGRLFDSLYQDILKDSKGNKKLAHEEFINQILAYTAGEAPGVGSSRIAIMHGDEVIKVALNEAGFAQNGIEATVGNDNEVDDIVVPVLSASEFMDHDGYLWIVSQKVKPLDIPGFSKDWQQVREALKQAALGNIPKSAPASGLKNVTAVQNDPDATKVAVPKGAAAKQSSQFQSSSISKMLTPDFLSSFSKLVSRYPEMNTGDLYKPDSWGESGNDIKLLDAGFTKSISKSYYKSTGSGLIFAGSEQAEKAKAEKELSRTSSIEDRRSQNEEFARDALNQPSFPQETALLLYIRGLVEPLPKAIFSYDPAAGFSKSDLRLSAKTLRDQENKVVAYIEKVKDSSLKNSLMDGLEGILALQGSLGESYLRRLIKMHLEVLI